MPLILTCSCCIFSCHTPGFVRYVKDPIRKGIGSKDAQSCLTTWARLQDNFEVLGVKNLFLLDDEAATSATGGMMHILVNVLAKAVDPVTGKPITFADMAADDAFWQRIRGEGSFGTSATRNLLREMIGNENSAVGAAPIEMIGEIQLHLDFFIAARKKTHMLFKILRAACIGDLVYDIGPQGTA